MSEITIDDTSPAAATKAHPERAYVVGIDLGGTKIRGGLADRSGTIVAEHTMPTPTGGPQVIAQLAELVTQLCSRVGVDPTEIETIGIGGAGVPDFEANGFSRAPNLTQLGGERFRASLAAVLGHPVVIENDVNVAALGEIAAGFGQQCRNFVCISVGTGIGMGIVVDGRLLRGAAGAAGEIGYLPIGADPFDPAHQVRGPLEEVLAGGAIVARYRELTAGEVDSTETIFERAAAADPAAVQVLDETARWLALAIASVDAVLDTEAVVLTGGIGGRPELCAQTRTWLARLGDSELSVCSSQLGPSGPVLGAVQLALSETSSPTPAGRAPLPSEGRT